MTKYSEIASPNKTPQSERARAEQVENSADGFVFALDKWKRFDRFLVLGSDAPTYYANERKLTRENVSVIQECLAEDGLRTVRRIVEISDAGRAPKNDPAIFALAMATGDKHPLTRAAALEALPKVCRIGTHLFHFAEDVGHYRRWGRSLRSAIAHWYNDKPVDALALQAVKYQQRDGWSHRDLLRLSHAKPKTPEHDAAFRWITGGGAEALAKETKRGKPIDAERLPRLIVAFDKLQRATDVGEVCALLREHKLPHEALPTQWKNDARVWDAMLDDMGTTALIRNLAKMTAVGLIAPMSDAASRAAKKLTDQEAIVRGRVHPLAILLAMGVYRQGHGDKGKLSWTPERAIVDALDAAFYLAFKTIEPTGKRHLLALDVSGSMTQEFIGSSRISAREASAAMAMVTARTEEKFHIVGFTSGGGGMGGRWGGLPPGLTPIDISPRQRLTDAIAEIQKLPMGGTDCALPMLYAAGKEIDVDVFTIYTDNETWAGAIHPFEALKSYRLKARKPDAKLVVVGMTATGFSIADPSDPGMLDVVGFDSAAPALMADFARG